MSKKGTYAQALAEMEEIITNIQSEKYTIDELSEKVRRVSQLITFCKDKLRETDDEINKVIKQMDDN
jgi:exodeoxyribonuclease VII small subunit